MGEKRSQRRLKAVRKQIDRLDEQLLKLVNRRAKLALKIGRIKKRRKWPVFDPKREGFVLKHVQQANGGPLSAAAIRTIFQTILSQCRRRERSGRKRIG
jgi:chorismate mutase-like protein